MTVRGLVVQVLGSGGPMHGGGRGSPAYLVRSNGRPVILVDVGGDTPTALARAGVEPAAIDALLISHLHPDHVSGLPDLLWGEITGARSRALPVFGPPGGDGFNDAAGFFDRLFGGRGAFPDLKGLLNGDPFQIPVTVCEGDGSDRFELGNLQLRVMRVPHGRVPSLAFRLDGAGTSVVFAGDQTAREVRFVDFARGADLMIVHAMVCGCARGQAIAEVVALPQDLGEAARSAGVGRVIVGHLMGRPPTAADSHLWSLSELDTVMADIASAYGGPVEIAEDLASYPVLPSLVSSLA